MANSSPPRSRSHRFSRFVALGLMALLVASCRPWPDGFASVAWTKFRQFDWLKFATETPVSPGTVGNVIAHLERDARDPLFSVPAGSLPGDARDGIIDKMW